MESEHEDLQVKFFDLDKIHDHHTSIKWRLVDDLRVVSLYQS